MKVLLSDQETQRRLALKKYNIIHSVIKLAFANITLQRQPAVPNKVRAFFTKITIGFWLASGILASVGLVAYQNLTDFKQAADWQIQKYQAVEQLQDLHFQLQTAALAQNRYLATTQKIYLSEYDRATLIIKQEILQLRQILGNNPHQKAQMTTIDSLVGKEIGLNDRIILD
nr:CHASE3 domain-containing protein [Nostocaceae cyanobacterium]